MIWYYMQFENITSYSNLQKQERKNLCDMLPLFMPIALFIDPSNYCNFKCKFCARSLPEYNEYVKHLTHIDFNLVERIFNEIKQYGKLKTLRLYYLGEPFLNPHFIDIVNLANVLEITDRIEITTNASLLKKEYADKLCEVAKNGNTKIYLRFSIYSVIQERHKIITNSNLDIKNIYNNIVYCKEIRDSLQADNLFLYAKMIDTFSEENELFLSLYRNVVDEAAIEPPMNWSGFNKSNLIRNAYEKDIQAIIKKKRNVCAYPFYSLTINADGSVVACCVDWSRKTILGNINEQTLYEIWNGPQANELRKLHLCGERQKNEACRYCEYLYSQPIEDNLDSLGYDEYARRLHK